VSGRRRPRARAAALSALVLLGLAPAARAARLPVHYSSFAASIYAETHINGPPPGANRWTCHPTKRHRRPVVLVHGTLENMAYNWYALSPLLVDHGYCVFALNYGQQRTRLAGFPGATHPGGTGRIEDSARQLGAFVARVRRATGARTVDIVGHSQGGMLPRYYMGFLGGSSRVHALVGLSPSNHGTTAGGLTSLLDRVPGGLGRGGLGRGGLGLACGAACEEQLVGSPFMRRLSATPDTLRGVAYTVVETKYDEVVTPYTSAFLRGARNFLLQATCARDHSEHLATPFDAAALRRVLNALDPPRAVTPRCQPVQAVLGG
jgi:triacylglycerol esterase/lipase EstA (alpha/beta hydrolase family)